MKTDGLSGMSLVTGASGFIGSRLLQTGDRALVRQAGTVAGEVVGDLLNPDSLATACSGVETVVHCAGFAHAFSSSDRQMHWRINVLGTRNLLEAAGRMGVRRFVFLSSVKAMADPGDKCVDEDWSGEPGSPYGQAKRAAEDAVLEAGRRFGMHVVNLRLAMTYGRGGRGNLERMAQGIRTGWFPPVPETGNRRSLVHVNDVVAAIRLAAFAGEANRRTYIVADHTVYSGAEIYDAVRTALGKQAALVRVPAGVLRLAGRLGDGIGTLMHRPFAMNSEAVDRLLGSTCYSPARIEKELGWRAEIGLEQGVQEMIGDETGV